jgi:hypothetical protein
MRANFSGRLCGFYSVARRRIVFRQEFGCAVFYTRGDDVMVIRPPAAESVGGAAILRYISSKLIGNVGIM